MSRIRLVEDLKNLMQIKCGLDRLFVPGQVMTNDAEFVLNAFTFIGSRCSNMLTLNIEIVYSELGIVTTNFILEYFNHFLYHIFDVDLV